MNIEAQMSAGYRDADMKWIPWIYFSVFFMIGLLNMIDGSVPESVIYLVGMAVSCFWIDWSGSR